MPRTVTCQAPLSMGFSKQEYWSGLPFPSPGDLPDPGLEAGSSALQVGSINTHKQKKSNPNTTLKMVIKPQENKGEREE